LSIIGSIIATYLSYVIYKYNRVSKAWLAVTLAFLLIIFRRSLGFAINLDLFTTLGPTLKSIENTLLLIISILYILGFWSMKKSFETFDIIEKKTRKKIKHFNILKKKLVK
jgi:hypothetical protein